MYFSQGMSYIESDLAQLLAPSDDLATKSIICFNKSECISANFVLFHLIIAAINIFSISSWIELLKYHQTA